MLSCSIEYPLGQLGQLYELTSLLLGYSIPAWLHLVNIT